MRLDGLEHPKVLDLAARLGVSLPTAIGHLELLWAFVAKLTPEGNVGKYPDGAIAGAARWDGDPTLFVDCLLITRLVDECAAHRLIVHDWPDHCPSWVRSKLKRAGLTLLGTPVPAIEPSRLATLVATPRARATPSVAKPSLAYIHGRSSAPTIVETPPQPPTAPPAEWVNGGKVPPPLDDPERMNAFAIVRLKFPHRAGRGHNWILAERAWGKLIDDGTSDPLTLEAGVDRYRAYVDGGGVSSDAYVMGADQFFSAVDRPWSQAWELPNQLRAGGGRKSFSEKLAALEGGIEPT